MWKLIVCIPVGKGAMVGFTVYPEIVSRNVASDVTSWRGVGAEDLMTVLMQRKES